MWRAEAAQTPKSTVISKFPCHAQPDLEKEHKTYLHGQLALDASLRGFDEADPLICLGRRCYERFP